MLSVHAEESRKDDRSPRVISVMRIGFLAATPVDPASMSGGEEIT